jgi:RNA polymerase sigma-70 factor (ECF subfamily)
MQANDMDQTADEELVERARTGDVDAFTRLVASYRAPALRFAYGIAGDEAEDAVQEAFVKAYRKLGSFRPGATFRPWLFTIVANEARNRRRSMSRHASLELRVRAQPLPDGAGSDALAVEQEQRRLLVAAVNGLSPQHREIVALRYFAGLTESEAAEVLACPAGTAKSRLSRALDQLRAALGEEVRL